MSDWIPELLGVLASMALAGWAALRKRRKGYVFRPRARIRFYASVRTHENYKESDPPEERKP